MSAVQGPARDRIAHRTGCAGECIAEDIPWFLADAPADGARSTREVYDEIYRHHQDVWEDQGRSEPFLRYFSELAAAHSAGTVLEIGCGEGAQLAALSARQKFGIDLSLHALLRARRRCSAACAVARAEELPFPTDSIDLVVSVGPPGFGCLASARNPLGGSCMCCRTPRQYT